MQNLHNTLSVGTIIRERYIVKGLIGKGNAGAVYLVEDQRVKRAKQRIFALKEIVGLSQQERYQFIFDHITTQTTSSSGITTPVSYLKKLELSR